MSKPIALETALKELRRFPALVVGPGVTSHSGIGEQIATQIANSPGISFSENRPQNYLELLDLLTTGESNTLAQARDVARRGLCNAPRSPLVRNLVSVRWSAIVSLAPDSCFEDALREKYDAMVSSWHVTLVDSDSVVPSRRSLPIYKLLGNPRDLREEYGPVLDSSSLLLRKQNWSRVLTTFPDHSREAPVLILGNESNKLFLREFFAALFSLPSPHPKTFLCLATDNVSEDPVIASLLRSSAKLIQVDATAKQFCDSASTITLSSTQSVLALPDPESSVSTKLSAALQPYAEYLDLVPREPPKDFNPSSRSNELVDALFRPTAIDWKPYLFDYHLPRTQALKLTTAIDNAARQSTSAAMRCFVLRGDAGSGKTCTMKQAALQLSKSGFLVLWLKRQPPSADYNFYRGLSRALAQTFTESEVQEVPNIAIFCDDPWNLRINPHDLTYELNAAGTPVTLVFAFRNSDLISESGVSLPIPVVPASELELSYDLDDEELSNLPNLLVKVSAFSDHETAMSAIRQLPSKRAADILCSLWYLAPATRSSLSLSLEDEYFRLGHTSHNFGVIENAVQQFGKNARLAYECVAVCSGFDIGLPTEVLVRVLKISFEEWHEICINGKPLWGLIYPDENPLTGEALYITRNEVVTNILLRLLNAGLGTSGEHRRLKDLVSACNVGTPPYRSFLVDLLVRNRRRLVDKFTLAQGIEIFELARQTFPYPDKTIEHQYGVWLKDKGADTERAYHQLQKALSTPDYPHANSIERSEHIHTTLAAVVLSQVRDGSRSVESGISEIREHLRLAQSADFFNPHTTHVFGTLLLDLAQIRDNNIVDINVLEAISEAIPMIERALQIIGASGSRTLRYAKDITMLTSLQSRILDSVDDIHELESIAEEIFQSSNSQIGFEVVARKLLYDASQKNRGRLYLKVKEYLDSCFELCRQKSVEPKERLIAVRADLYIRWQIQRTAGAVNWQMLTNDLQFVLASPLFRDDVVKMFYLAVGLYHTDQFTEANALFARLRSTANVYTLKHSVRAYHVGKEGAPKRYQGIIRYGHGRYYMEVGELGTDLPIKDSTIRLNPGASRPCYVGFSFFGPQAILTRPTVEQLRVPV